MNISEVWMRLEALVQLRQLPQYSAIRKHIEEELANYNATFTTVVLPPTTETPAEGDGA